jgi:hypothetical protein
VHALRTSAIVTTAKLRMFVKFTTNTFVKHVTWATKWTKQPKPASKTFASVTTVTSPIFVNKTVKSVVNQTRASKVTISTQAAA